MNISPKVLWFLLVRCRTFQSSLKIYIFGAETSAADGNPEVWEVTLELSELPAPTRVEPWWFLGCWLKRLNRFPFIWGRRFGSDDWGFGEHRYHKQTSEQVLVWTEQASESSFLSPRQVIKRGGLELLKIRNTAQNKNCTTNCLTLHRCWISFRVDKSSSLLV